MKTKITVILLTMNLFISFGQKTDYVVLKQSETRNKDTVYGDIIFPNGKILMNVKIVSNNEKIKYHPNQTIKFKYQNRHFYSVPYNSKENVFAEKIIDGDIKLYHYNTNLNNSNNGGALGALSIGISDYFFIKSNATDTFLKVPHSREKAKSEILEYFKGNENFCEMILSDEFRIYKLPEIINNFNNQRKT